MKVFCPACSALVLAKDINLDKGWGKCEACNELFPLAGIIPNLPKSSLPHAPAERPFNARAILERSARELSIEVPAMGMRAGAWGLLGFASFWLAFIAFWTAGAVGLFGGGNAGPVNWIFASFSIPFWLVGFGMLGAVLWMARGTTSVHFDPQEMVARKQCLAWSRTRRIELSRVQRARAYQQLQQQNATNTYTGVEIIYESGSFTLPADSEDEREWLIYEINDFLEAVSV